MHFAATDERLGNQDWQFSGVHGQKWVWLQLLTTQAKSAWRNHLSHLSQTKKALKASRMDSKLDFQGSRSASTTRKHGSTQLFLATTWCNVTCGTSRAKCSLHK